MKRWSPQHFLQQGRRDDAAESVLRNAVAIGRQVTKVHEDLPPVFTLRHLCHLTGVKYGFLRAVVTRVIRDPYTTFSIHKRGVPSHAEFRIICVPTPALMTAQRWISRRILSCGVVHEASFAYSKGSDILSAAELHLECAWLIKLDVRRFFESISEVAVYRAFRALGYQPLVSFEMARICTRVGGKQPGHPGRWRCGAGRYWSIPNYQRHRMGSLPQGAPTSPMLSNLVMQKFDDLVAEVASRHALVYTRYADDLILSTQDRTFTKSRAAQVIREVYGVMGSFGLSPNIAKTRIVHPGGRKVVLGLNVDRDRVHVSREVRDRVRQHLYYLRKPNIGPALHAQRRGFASVLGLKNHLQGIVAFIEHTDPKLGALFRNELDGVTWPF